MSGDCTSKVLLPMSWSSLPKATPRSRWNVATFITALPPRVANMTGNKDADRTTSALYSVRLIIRGVTYNFDRVLECVPTRSVTGWPSIARCKGNCKNQEW
jgi:hypothetical protein